MCVVTLPEAIRAADSGAPEYLPIRRKGWVRGLHIWYSRASLRWLVETGIGPTELLDLPTQQCLTPETMLADDWEVVDP